MASCKFMSCPMRKTCDRRFNPWQDQNVCNKITDYINQDYVAQRELTFTVLGVDVTRVTDEINVFQEEAKIKRDILIYQMYFLDHKPVKYISEHLSIPEITIYKFLSRIKKKMLNMIHCVEVERLERRVKRYKKEMGKLKSLPNNNTD